MLETSIYIHHLAVLEETLGPGRRLVIWMTGCPYRCPGCIEKKLRDLEYGEPYPVAEFYEKITPLLSSLKAVTFSGGEPLLQRDACAELFSLIKDDADVDLMLYTGMTSTLFNRDYSDFHRYVDICVTEPFKVELHGNHLWRGSSNQKIISPSGRHQALLRTWMKQKSSGIRLHFEKDEAYIYGIPAPEMQAELNLILKKKQVDIGELREVNR